MSSKKYKCYNDILSYLEDRDDEIYQFIIDLSLQNHFDVKGKAGITFLNPLDENFRKELRKKIDKGDNKNYDNAVDMLSAHVIFDYLKNPDDFRSKYDDIPNALGQHIEIDYDKTNSKEVRFTKGKAVIDEFFNPKKSLKVAIFDLENYIIPIDGKEASSKYIKKKTRRNGTNETDTSIDVNNEQTIKLRFQIKQEVEQEFCYNYKKKKNLEKIYKNTFVYTTLSLIHYILTKEKEMIGQLYYERILPLMSFTPADFYLIFEPYKKSEEFLIPNGIIERWYQKQSRFKFNLNQLMNKIMEDLEQTKLPYVIYNDRMKLQCEIDELRQKLQNPKNPRKYPSLIYDCYKKISEKNTILKAKDIYPGYLSEQYKINVFAKLVEDEMRYMLNYLYERLDEDFESDLYRSFIEMAENYMNNKIPAENRLRILNQNILNCEIQPEKQLSDIRRFINSTYFVYTPLTFKEALSDDFPITPSNKNIPEGDETGLWNIHGLTLYGYKNLFCNHEDDDNDELSDLLSKLLEKSKHKKLTKKEQELVGKLKET